MILILHEARTGNELLIRPDDIKYGEARSNYTIIAHLMPVPTPGVKDASGHVVRPPGVTVIIKETEVMESVDEIQGMTLRLKQLESTQGASKVLIQRHRDTAKAIAMASFGNGPRDDSAKPVVEIARD